MKWSIDITGWIPTYQTKFEEQYLYRNCKGSRDAANQDPKNTMTQLDGSGTALSEVAAAAAVLPKFPRHTS
jgi:hypothetical protein